MDDVAFYDSQVQYQKRIGEIEKERLKLEREMFSMMRSDKKLQNLKAAKLKSLWQQVCEREKRARERDEQLLKDFESMEVELSVIQARTSKLRRMKEEYDVKVKQMYPQWRKEVEIARAKKQLRERGIKMSPRKDNVEPLSHPQRVHNEAPERESRYEASPRMEDPGNMRRPKKPAEPVSIQSNEPSLNDTSKTNVNESVSSHKRVFTSTPVSAVAKPEIVSQGSGPVQPPPESFADVTPQKVVYVNATSPIRSSASEGRNVVHTIPTAQSLQEEPSEVSEPSTFSEQDRLGEKPQQASDTVPAQRPWMMAQTSGDGRHLSSEKETISHHSAKHVARPQSPRRTNKPESLPSSSPAKSVDNISPRRHTQTKSPNSTLSSVGQQPKSSGGDYPSLVEPLINRPNISDSKMEKAASISSFSSDNMSPRENAPLTANAAYQALLKQHSSAGPAAINIPDAGEESDEDDLENLLSPHEPMEKRNFTANQQVDNSVSGSEENFSDRVESPVYIPTAMSARSSRSGKEATKVAQTKPPKVPWDTDTEDEDSFEDTSFMATGGSSLRHSNKKAEPLDPEDDFDFYD